MHDAGGWAGGAWAAEQRAVLSARPSGPAPGLGDAGRRLRGAKSPKTRFLSAGRVVQLARCGEVASQRHVSMHVGPVEPARLLFCVRSSVPRRPIKGPKVGEGPPFIHLEQAPGLTDQQCCGTFVTPRESSTTMRAGCWEAAHLTSLGLKGSNVCLGLKNVFEKVMTKKTCLKSR